MDTWTFGWTLALIGMVGTMLVLWLLSLLILVDKKSSPINALKQTLRKDSFTSWNPHLPRACRGFSSAWQISASATWSCSLSDHCFFTWESTRLRAVAPRADRFRRHTREHSVGRYDGQRRLSPFFYDNGVLTEVFPLLIFVGIGAMTDFQPLLENPKIILLGAAGQFGIFLTLLLALALGFDKLDAVAVAIIGACDGPTAIYVSSKFAPHMLGAVSVAAYSYMSLVPLIQPPIMRALTSEKERQIIMGAAKREPISKPLRSFSPSS